MSQDARPQSGSDKGNNKVNVIIIAVLAVVILALVAVIAYLIGRGGANAGNAGETNTSVSTREVANESRMILEEKEAENVMEEMRKEVEEGMFECAMSMEWTFEDGNSESKDAYIENSVNNRHPFYFDVILDGTEEVVYSSPVVPVGAVITNLKLDKPLSAGTYKAVCKYVLLDDEVNQQEISSAGFVVTITVQN